MYVIALVYLVLHSGDLDLDPMTLICEPDLDIMHTKNTLSRSRLSKVRARTGQTDTHRHRHTQTDRRTDRQKRPKLLSATFARGKNNDNEKKR